MSTTQEIAVRQEEAVQQEQGSMAEEAKTEHRTERCTECNMILPDEEALLEHWEQKLMNGEGHFHCALCTRLFKTWDALCRHKREIHPDKQALECPGCGIMFSRAGALIGHIESDQCKGLRSAEWEKDRENKLAFARELELRNQGIEYNPAGRASSVASGYTANTTGSVSTVHFTDYISRMADSVTINSLSRYRITPETSARPNPVAYDYNEYPRLPTQEYRHGNRPDLLTDVHADTIEQHAENKWAEKKNLFPAAPPAVRPTPGQLQALAEQSKPEEEDDPFNPRNPSFDAKRYYVSLTQKFQCPHKLCGKTFKSAGALSGHLLSAAHARRQLQCPSCLRWFKSHAALAQHAEAPGAVRCTVSESNNYRTFMDQLTSGLTDAKGRHEDGTQKFIVPKEAYNKFSKHEQLQNNRETELGSSISKFEEEDEEKVPAWGIDEEGW